jgi:hypothetical protein
MRHNAFLKFRSRFATLPKEIKPAQSRNHLSHRQSPYRKMMAKRQIKMFIVKKNKNISQSKTLPKGPRQA